MTDQIMMNLRAALDQFWAAKFPDAARREWDIKEVTSTDEYPKGVYLCLDPETLRGYLLQRQRGLSQAFAVARNAARKPHKTGVYLDVGATMLWLGESESAAVAMLSELTAQFATPPAAA